MWQWCVSRSSNAVVIFASPNTLDHSAKSRFVLSANRSFLLTTFVITVIVAAVKKVSRSTRVALPLEGQIFVALQKAANGLAQEAEQLLKAGGLTGVQYNVLRILRGAETES